MRLFKKTTQPYLLPRPAISVRLLTFALLSLTILLWPGVLETFVVLDWQVGNMRPIAYGLQAGFSVATIASWYFQREISTFYHETFPTRRTLILAISVCFLALFFGLGIAEFICYLLDLPFKPVRVPSETALARFDPELGWTYVPNHSAVQTFGRDQREIAMHFSSIGSRVRAPGSQLDPAAPTIIFVGCSYTMGHGLLYEETVAGMLEALPDFPLQVVNLGVQGYGTDQALLLLKRYFRTFNTKVVVYGFICDHLKRNANYDRRHIHPNARFLGTKPLFALRRDGTLWLKKPPRKYEELRYSRLWAAVQIAMTEYGPERTPDLTRALVQEMRDYVSSNGATFVLLDWKWKRRKRCKNDDYFRGMNVNILNAADNAPPNWRTWTVPGDNSHPGVQANRYVARRLLDELKRLQVLPRTAPKI